jgi:hypothetical protein
VAAGTSVRSLGSVQAWKVGLAGDISWSFVEQVTALLETVRQMDSTLQRRSKQLQHQQQQSATGTTDSEKIALQIRLDIEAYGGHLERLGVNLENISAYTALKKLKLESMNA